MSDYNISVLIDDMNDFAGHLLPRYPSLPGILQNIYAARGQNESDHLYWFKSITDVFSGAFFTAFMAREVDYYLANNNSNVYLYEFTGPSGLINLEPIIGEILISVHHI
jgi:hypothetical protein